MSFVELADRIDYRRVMVLGPKGHSSSKIAGFVQRPGQNLVLHKVKDGKEAGKLM
jgi:hypothetical protein